MIKNSKFMKIYSDIINEDKEETLSDQFYDEMQSKLRKKLVPICTEQIELYEQYITDKNEWNQAVESLKGYLIDADIDEDQRQVKQALDNALSQAEQIANNIKSNMNNLDQYLDINIKQRVENKSYLGDFHDYPDQHLSKENCNLFPVIFLKKLITTALRCITNYTIKEQWKSKYEKYQMHWTEWELCLKFKSIETWIKSSIKRQTNKLLVNPNSKDTGYTDRFDQPISVGDEILFTAGFNIEVGRVEKRTAFSISISSKSINNSKGILVIKKEDIKKRVVNIAKLNDIDWGTYVTDAANNIEI